MSHPLDTIERETYAEALDRERRERSERQAKKDTEIKELAKLLADMPDNCPCKDYICKRLKGLT